MRAYKRKKFTVETAWGEKVSAIAYVAISTRFGEPTYEYLEAVAGMISSFWSLTGVDQVTPDDLKVE